MGRWLWLAAALATGCGNVAKAERAVDAALPDALSCTAPQAECNGVCIDITTSKDHCGACDVSCGSPREACEVSHCVDQTSSCAKIFTSDPSAKTGMYTLLDQTVVYCDATVPDATYNGLFIAPYNSAPAGYDIVTAAKLADPVAQTAFVTFFNSQGGVHPIATFTPGTCCYKADATNDPTFMFFGMGNYLIVSTVSPPSGSCGVALNPSTAYTFALAGSAVQVPPLAADFFATHAPTAAAECTAANNAAFFWRRRS